MDDAVLAAAKSRLDRLSFYGTPVRMTAVRLVVWPWFFRLPFVRRFDGYALPERIVLRQAPSQTGAEDLVTHELCHVWQMQRRPLRMPLSYLLGGYAVNGYEAEARLAVELTSGGRGRPDVAGIVRTLGP
jgi:hypothetical protein